MSAPTLESLIGDFHLELGLLKKMVVCNVFARKIKNRNVSPGEGECLEEAFSYIWNLEEAQRCLTPTRVFSEKSNADSDRLREEGNKYYKRKDFRKALDHYNLSILAAPHPQLDASKAETKCEGRGNDLHLNDTEKEATYKELAWGYTNRSAVLLVLKEYKKCLRDIDLALQCGISEVLRNKLEDRRLKCLASQNKAKKAGREDTCSLPKLPVPPKLRHQNPSLPSLSNAVKLAYTPAKGRHLVSVRNIRPGEVLGVEESYCNSLGHDRLHSHCSVCLIKCNAPLPCPNCSMVIFCSASCREKGLREDHWLECGILPSFTALEISHRLILVYKMLNRTPYTELKRLKPLMEKEVKRNPTSKCGFDKDGVYCSRDYRSLYHLVTNKNKRSSQDLYAMCLMAVVLTKILEQSGKYFVQEDGKPYRPSENDLLMIGAVLFNHLMQMESNYHPIQITDSLWEKDTSDFVGVYPTMSMMNHSCIPTTTYNNCGRTMVLMSIRSIPLGAEVSECYGPSYDLELAPIRDVLLQSEFLFCCSCEACENDWPIGIFLPDIRFKCFKCQYPFELGDLLKCPGCSTDYRKSKFPGNERSQVHKWWQNILQVKEAEENASRVALLMKIRQAISDQDCNDLCRFVELLEKHVHLPCAVFCQAQHWLAAALLAKTVGN